MRRILKRLIETPSVTGFEGEVRKIVAEEFKRIGLGVDVDVLGNVVGVRADGEKYRLMLAAHMDQIGLMVTHINEKGNVYFSAKGYDPRVLYGQQVVFYTEKGPVYGVIGAKAAHLVKAEEREKARKLEEMAIDFGVDSREKAEEIGLKPGVVGTTLLIFREIVNEMAIGVGFDDKAGVAVIVKTMEMLGDEKLNGTVYAVTTAQEEVGLRGAIVSAYRVKPDIAIAVDVTHAVSMNVEESIVAGIQLGKGPVIGVGPNFHPKLWRMMEEVCKEKNIPYQIGPTPAASGTDAWVIQVSREGVITGLISIPLRYMHSPGEMISLRDLENTSRLLAEAILRIDGADWRSRFSVSI